MTDEQRARARWIELENAVKRVAYVQQHFKFENPRQAIRHEELMALSMSQWPEGLQDYMRIIGVFIGHSGDVFADGVADYIKAGEPDVLLWHPKTGPVVPPTAQRE